MTQKKYLFEFLFLILIIFGLASLPLIIFSSLNKDNKLINFYKYTMSYTTNFDGDANHIPENYAHELLYQNDRISCFNCLLLKYIHKLTGQFLPCIIF